MARWPSGSSEEENCSAVEKNCGALKVVEQPDKYRLGAILNRTRDVYSSS